IVAMLGLAAGVSTAAVQDVGLPNSSVENWTGGNADNWTKPSDTTWTQDTNYVVDGSYSMNVYNASIHHTRDLYQDSMPVTAGALYDGRFYCRVAVNSGHSSGYIRWYDSSNAFISDSSITTKGGPYGEISAGARYYYESVRAPTNAARACFHLRISGRDSTRSMNIDDITMYGGAPVNTINETIETRNAGLEVWNSTTSPDGWSVADGQQHSGSYKNSGSYSLQIDSGAAYQLYSWGEQVIAGDQYEAKFWARKSATGGHAKGYLTWYDEEYAVVSKHSILGNTDGGDIWAGTRWYDETLTAPTGATRARFSIEGVDASVTVWVDDVTLTNLTPEPATMTLLLLGLPLALRRRRK
ncbi:MAG: hypothetical protein K8R02_00870, partial [Anaerohalosphaeraceae bacterium]|nr:hypothetical protein [Anaerohalosphaeraceae bacterium]